MAKKQIGKEMQVGPFKMGIRAYSTWGLREQAKQGFESQPDYHLLMEIPGTPQYPYGLKYIKRVDGGEE